MKKNIIAMLTAALSVGASAASANCLSAGADWTQIGYMGDLNHDSRESWLRSPMYPICVQSAPALRQFAEAADAPTERAAVSIAMMFFFIHFSSF